MNRIISFKTAKLMPRNYDGDSGVSYTLDGEIVPRNALNEARTGNTLPAPLLDQLGDWLRERYHYHVYADKIDDNGWYFVARSLDSYYSFDSYGDLHRLNHDDALEEGLAFTLETLKFKD